MSLLIAFISYFFFNDTATTEIYTLSLHDALPISGRCTRPCLWARCPQRPAAAGDRKSTRLNSSHLVISYAVFCLKKKKILVVSANVDDKQNACSISCAGMTRK